MELTLVRNDELKSVSNVDRFETTMGTKTDHPEVIVEFTDGTSAVFDALVRGY